MNSAFNCIFNLPGGSMNTEVKRAKPGPKESKERITPEQMRVLDLVVEGLNNHEIAFILEMSPVTVKVHVWKILKKTKHKSRNRLIVAELKRRHQILVGRAM